jgi:glycosyltransferase involved in cell wall biosynthesis
MAARRLDAEMRTGGFDFIHLNSAVLNPLVAPDLPFIIHTREYVCRPGARTMERFGHARGVIFIDEGTREPFRDVSLSHWTVLSNPVDMTPLRQGYTLEAAQQHYQVGADNVVFTALGRIDENKGIAFLIDSFRRVPDPRFILLVVGAGVPGDPCEEECRRLAAGDSRIRFAGEQADPMPVYLISDYVMRGESRHLVGRTMIEGLYAGCHLIVPGTPEETSRTPELAAAYPDRVHLYPPRDGTALAGLIAGLTRKAGDRSFRSNALEYARAFMAFVREVTGRGNGVAAVPAAG